MGFAPDDEMQICGKYRDGMHVFPLQICAIDWSLHSFEILCQILICDVYS